LNKKKKNSTTAQVELQTFRTLSGTKKKRIVVSKMRTQGRDEPKKTGDRKGIKLKRTRKDSIFTEEGG